MSSAEELPEELKSFEAELSALSPAASRIDRDRLMYGLGAQAALADLNQLRAADSSIDWRVWLERPRLWQAAALVLACTSVGLGSLLVASPRYVDRVVYVPQPIASPPDATAAKAPSELAEALDAQQPTVTFVNANRSRPKASERWLTAMATPGFNYPQDAELRVRAPRVASDPSTPIIVAAERGPASSAGHADDRQDSPPLRWSDHRQWIEFLNPASH